MVKLGNDWDEILSYEFEKPYYLELREFLKEEYRTKTIYPNMNNIFEALKRTSYKDTKVLILGQDPYHGENQAHGLAFSVQPNVAIPPSLLNIYKELQSDEANSHKGIGWETFTDRIIELLSERTDPVIFVLWGANARKKTALIDTSKHYILEAPHPSPLSARRGFFGCKHFSKINEILIELGKKPIDWQIKNI